MKKLLLFAVALFLMTTALKASHVAGGELTYQWIGGSDYQITFNFYRDCSGVSEPSQVDVSFHSDSCGWNFIVTLLPIPGTGQEIIPSCPSQLTTCNGGTLYGVRKWVYQGTVSLDSCSDWVMSCTISARNPITTLSSSGNFYIEAHLDNLTVHNNSSPVFTNDPVNIIYVNQPFCLESEAFDVDGDSLVYSLVPPLTGANTTVFYSVPYSYQQFLYSVPPITIDSSTGDVCMTPTSILNSVAAVKVEEYRNGIKIGSVTRDLQLNVIGGNNNIPMLAGINLSATQYDATDTIYEMTVFADDTARFDVFSMDADTADKITLTITDEYGSIPGYSFNVTGQNTTNAIGHFEWVTDSTDTLNNPHCFIVTATDNHCPYVGSKKFIYCINVIKYSAGLPEIAMNNNIKVYPNPSKGIFTVSISKATELSVTNIQGQEVYSKHLSPISKQEQINLNGCAKGIYFLKVTGENFVKVEKVIMQ